MRTRLHAFATLALTCLAVSVSACADANPVVEPPPEPFLVAQYGAVELNGVPLPFEIGSSGGTAQFVDNERVELFRDGTASRGEMLRAVQMATSEVVRSTTSANYRYSYIGDTLRLVTECATDTRCPAPLDFLRDGTGLKRILSSNPIRVISYVRGLPF